LLPKLKAYKCLFESRHYLWSWSLRQSKSLERGLERILLLQVIQVLCYVVELDSV